MKLVLRFVFLLVTSSIISCKVSEPQTQSPVSDPLTADIIEDSTMAPEKDYQLRLYRSEQTRHFKLLHTKLEVSFDWEKQQLLGNANLIIQPYFYEQSNLVLDAKDFEVHRVSILNGSDTLRPIYEYDGRKLNITLDRTYTRSQKIYVEISYTAMPNASKDSLDFSNDKAGLYFINPYDSIKNKPQQIWTHGETTTSSKWFPTIDAPNQKSTQEVFITVHEKFKTLSNGKLIYSKSNADGTRTDYWKMDQPHAPYLFMMAIGDFAIVEEEWKGKKIDYYVEPEFEQYADDIFGNTPEMISLFSELLNYPYPWNKYSQVVVRDFVSGAMENTTASVFMEDLQVNSRELIDYNWDDIIAHELFHQLFGDLVTCESWANIPLNESFATYGEYLWKNHKYGKDESDYHLYEELQTYLEEAEEKQVDLIRFDYLDEDEMFDGHSYAKGGLILHMLRNYLGDEAFFKSLEYYLKSHEYGKAEVHELRLAFEHISGEDLNWFFNQWFLDAGHPVLRLEEAYSEENRTLTLKVWQEQDSDLYPVYKLPLMLDIWENGNKSQYMVEIDRPYQEFEFEDLSNPDLLLLDSDYILVGENDHPKTAVQWDFQYHHYDSSFRARHEAFQHLIEQPEIRLTRDFLTDPFWVIREETLLAIDQDTTDLFQELENDIINLADNDSNSLVRAAALSVLGSRDREKYQAIFRKHLYDSSYAVAGNALYAYLQTQADDIPEVLQSLHAENNFSITSSLADYYILEQDYAQYPWFKEKLRLYQGSDLWYFIKLFGMYLVTAPPDIVDQGIMDLAWIGKYHNQYFNRLSAYQSLQLLSDIEGVMDILADLKSHERDQRIIQYYD